MTETDDSSTDATGTETVTRQFDTDRADPNVQVVSVISELENVSVGELPPLYSSIDHILEHLYSNPPKSDADVEMAFTYYGYRVTVEQNGNARFERLNGE